MNNKSVHVAFRDTRLESLFESLRGGKFEDKKLYDSINRAIQEIKKSPSCGIKIPSRLWPSTYVKEYRINNLWKYDLPDGWRLIYTIKVDEVRILNIILDWFSHKEYEKKFRY